MSGRSRRRGTCCVCKRRPGLYSRWLHGVVCRRCWRARKRRLAWRWLWAVLTGRVRVAGWRDWLRALRVTFKAAVKG